MSDDNKSMHVGVFSPNLQGFYFGELIGQIQQLCMLKSYDFSLIQTNSFGEYRSLLHTDHLDIVIVLRNAIHNELAQVLRDSGKAVVSIAYDFFPIDIPVVSCNNELGVEHAFNHLISNENRSFAYIGDLSQFDLRKRYEAFCDQHEINGFELDDNNIFVVSDTLFSGGIQAAKEFIERDCKATGILCGAGLTSIGFSQHLEELDKELWESLDIVAFDAISIIPATASKVSVVDQNMYLLAHKAVEQAEKIFRNEECEHQIRVEPKLITANTDYMQAEEAFLATSVELGDLHNANYMKTVISNIYEWPKEVAKSKLKNLMMLAPVFPRQLKMACFGRVVHGNAGRELIKVTRAITPENFIKVDVRDKASLCAAAKYAPALDGFDTSDCNQSIHIPIYQDGKMWAVLSAFGENKYDERPSSMTALCGYLSHIGDYLAIEIQGNNQSSTPQEKSKSAENEVSDIVGTVTWNARENIAQWDENALELLGLNTPLERNIYQSMDLIDRIHEGDEKILRESLQRDGKEEFNIKIRLKHKNKSYRQFNVECCEDPDSGALVCKLVELEANH